MGNIIFFVLFDSEVLARSLIVKSRGNKAIKIQRRFWSRFFYDNNGYTIISSFDDQVNIMVFYKQNWDIVLFH